MSENVKAKRLFNLLERACLEFNSEVYNSGLSQVFRGWYIGIQQAAKIFWIQSSN